MKRRRTACHSPDVGGYLLAYMLSFDTNLTLLRGIFRRAASLSEYTGLSAHGGDPSTGIRFLIISQLPTTLQERNGFSQFSREDKKFPSHLEQLNVPIITRNVKETRVGIVAKTDQPSQDLGYLIAVTIVCTYDRLQSDTTKSLCI